MTHSRCDLRNEAMELLLGEFFTEHSFSVQPLPIDIQPIPKFLARHSDPSVSGERRDFEWYHRKSKCFRREYPLHEPRLDAGPR